MSFKRDVSVEHSTYGILAIYLSSWILTALLETGSAGDVQRLHRMRGGAETNTRTLSNCPAKEKLTDRLVMVPAIWNRQVFDET